MLMRLSLNQGPLVLRIVLNKRVKGKSVSNEKKYNRIKNND